MHLNEAMSVRVRKKNCFSLFDKDLMYLLGHTNFRIAYENKILNQSVSLLGGLENFTVLSTEPDSEVCVCRSVKSGKSQIPRVDFITELKLPPKLPVKDTNRSIKYNVGYSLTTVISRVILETSKKNNAATVNF